MPGRKTHKKAAVGYVPSHPPRWSTNTLPASDDEKTGPDSRKNVSPAANVNEKLLRR